MSFVNAYNFISLKDGKKKKKYCEYNDNEEPLTGKIKCRLITKTELIIPDNELGTQGRKEIINNQEIRTSGDYPFMTVEVDGEKKPMIPGSSLRGMFRNAFEAITDSCVFMNDDYYFSLRIGEPKEPGLLKKTDTGWELYKAIRYGEGCRHRKDVFPADNRYMCNRREGSSPHCRFREQCYSVSKPYKPFLKDYKMGQSVYIQITGNKINIKSANPGGYKEGYVLIADDNYNMKSSGRSVFVQDKPIPNFPKDDKDIFEAFEDNIQKYISNDKKGFAKKYYELYENIKTNNGIIPVWFKEYNGKYYFALSQMSRNVYTKKPKDIIKDKHTNLKHCENSGDLCPACALFGFISEEKEDFSAGSKVRFSDAWYNGNEKILSETKKLLPVLSNPRSSSLEFYLRHDDDFYHADHDGVTLSGRKFYWHHSNFCIKGLEPPDNDKLHLTSKVEYAEKKAEFSFDVYFDGITKTQLEQLYTAITYSNNEPDGKLCHKIGHGKPLGFGSVKVIADKVYVRSFVNGEYEEDKDYKVNPVVIPPEVKMAVDFYAIPGDIRIDYPRYNGNGTIFKWFSENRSLGNNPQYRKKLPRILDKTQIMPDDPKSNFISLSPPPQNYAKPTNNIAGICPVCGGTTGIDKKTGKHYPFCGIHSPNNNKK